MAEKKGIDKANEVKIIVFDNFEDCRYYDRHFNRITYQDSVKSGEFAQLYCKDFYETPQGIKEAKKEVSRLRAMHLRDDVTYESEHDFLPEGYSEDWLMEITTDVVYRFGQNESFAQVAFSSQMQDLQLFYRGITKMNWLWPAAIHSESFSYMSEMHDRYYSRYGIHADSDRIQESMERIEKRPGFRHWYRMRYVSMRFDILHKCFRDLGLISENGELSANNLDTGKKKIFAVYGPKYKGIEKKKKGYVHFDKSLMPNW